MPDVIEECLQNYLSETLGLASRVSPWERQGELPYYLQEAFDWRELDLAGQDVLLAIDRGAEKPSLAEVRNKLGKARSLYRQPILYVIGTLASYERRYLIDQKVPFVVPGNQLFLPDLGIDLREYFRARLMAPETTLSPAAQAILITLLWRATRSDAPRSAELAAALGYTSMTLSRALRELTTHALVAVQASGRSRQVVLTQPPSDIWQNASSLLRTPVKCIEWALPHDSLPSGVTPLAGVSALSDSTMLAEPRWPIRAVSPTRWKHALEEGLQVLPDWMPGAIAWQIWRYDPLLGERRETVDPLSLTLSLRDEEDDRVRMALSELVERFPW
jgi:DNA-binding MarR family transcriptional regulator